MPDGAWGWRFPSVPGASHILIEAPAWDEIELQVIEDDWAHQPEPRWDETGMRMMSPSGALLEVTWPRSVTLRPRHKVDEQLIVQPHLPAAVAAMALWRGWQAFHAGAFELNGRAWGVLGANESGKSSLLVSAAAQGLRIIADDLLVIAENRALAGPSCIDLRPDAARFLGVGEKPREHR